MDKQSFLIVSILVIVVVMGFVFVTKKNANINSPQEPKEIISQSSSNQNSTVPGISATQVTKDFYNAYVDCLKNPPAGSAGKISLYCQQNNDFASTDLSQNLEAIGNSKTGLDPVICAKNPTPAISVDKEDKVQENTVKTHVSELFGIGNVVIIDVDLHQEENAWKVANISCEKS